MKQDKKTNWIDFAIGIVYLLFFLSLIASFRAISSISIGLIIVLGISRNKIKSGSFFHETMKQPMLAALLLLFLLQLISLPYSGNKTEAWNNITLKTGLFLTAFAVCCCGYINETRKRFLLTAFAIMISVAALFCLLMAAFFPAEDRLVSAFFYHELVRPLRHHAVFFSLMVFVALIFILESIRTKTRTIPLIPAISIAVFLSIFLLLLSSKLVIAVFLIFLLFFLLDIFRQKHIPRITSIGLFIFILIAIVSVFITSNPVSNRFKEIASGDLSILNREKYSPADYFNGLQFRLLQWKLVPEILNENKAWLTGVTSADAQSFLDKKYIEKNMYQGSGDNSSHGYLHYNTHNQFLESLLHNGIPGLLSFIIICILMIRLMLTQRNRELIFVNMLWIAWAFAESVFQTQYGMIIFIFFPLFLFQSSTKAD